MMYDGPLDGGATDREYVRWLVPSWGTAAEIGVGDDWSRGAARHYEPRPLVTGSFGWPAWADPLQGGAELNAWRSKERPKLDYPIQGEPAPVDVPEVPLNLLAGTLTGDDPDRWRRPPPPTQPLPPEYDIVAPDVLARVSDEYRRQWIRDQEDAWHHHEPIEAGPFLRRWWRHGAAVLMVLVAWWVS